MTATGSVVGADKERPAPGLEKHRYSLQRQVGDHDVEPFCRATMPGVETGTYGAVEDLARNRVNLNKVITYWPNMLATPRELKLPMAHRTDLVHDRTRVISRLRELLERQLQVTNTGPLVLLTGYQTPAALRQVGRAGLETWLRNRKVRGAVQFARAAIDAVDRRHQPARRAPHRPADHRSTTLRRR
ncbi:hypothetical protein AB0L25_20740 [Spirillospora sp. NPDC052242]